MTEQLKEKTPPQLLVSTFTAEPELMKMKGSTDYKTYREMRRHPTIKLARKLTIAPILAGNWSIESEEGVDQEIIKFIREQITPIRNHVLKKAMLGCIDFGWQPFEKIWAVNEQGLLVIKKLKPLIQDYTSILINKENGAYVGLRQWPQTGSVVDLPSSKTLLFNQDVEGTYWYGESTMETAKGAYIQWNVVEAAAVKYDRKIAGSHWVVHYPLGQSTYQGVKKDNYDIAKAILASLESSGAIAVPRRIDDTIAEWNENSADAWKIELMGDEGTGGDTFTSRQKYLDSLMVRAFDVPERSVLEGQFGTKAEAEAHADLAIINMEVLHDELVQIMNWHLVNQLLVLNFGKEYENKVYISAAPLTDFAIGFLRELYKSVLSSPEGFLSEIDSIDMEALKDRVEVPVKPQNDIDIIDYVDPLLGVPQNDITT